MGQETAEVVVIGGGIIGCATAYNLARRGVRVTLVEKGTIGDEQSGRAWGFVRQQGRDPAEIPMMMECNKIWAGLAEELEADIEWVQGGNLALARDEERLAQFEESVKTAKEFGLDSQIITRQQLGKLLPSLRGQWLGGMYSASDGHAEPIKTTLAFAKSAIRHGATLRTLCAVEGIEVSNDRIHAVVTEKGVIRTPIVVCAAGAWSSKIARMVGLSLPQRVVRATVLETTPVSPVTEIGVWASGVSFRQRSNGSFYVAGGGGADYDVTLESFKHLRLFLPNYLKNRALVRMNVGHELFTDIANNLPGSPAKKHPFAHTVGIEPKPNVKKAERALQNFVELFPDLQGIGIKQVWAGRIDATPDAIPVLCQTVSPQGFIFATGFSGHGFAMGPITGVITAQMILDGKSSLDLHAMRFTRFSEGKLPPPRNVL